MVGLIFGHAAIQELDSRKLIHKNQFGCPGGRCQDAAIITFLFFLIAHYSQTLLGLFASNTTACFDCIVMDFFFAILIVSGVNLNLTRFWEVTLKHICHQVRTAFGISLAFYVYCIFSKIFGPGQGSCGGPAACTVTTSVLLEVLDKLAIGVTFTDPNQAIHYKGHANMFLNDQIGCTNNFQQWLYI